MSGKRMRVFAGPNGSGKSTILSNIKEKVNFGVYVNADDIEKSLNIKKCISFKDFDLIVQIETISEFFKNSQFSPLKRNEADLYKKLEIKDNCLIVNAHIDSYLCADIAEFIRQQLLFQGKSFTYETVMSHPGKLDFFQKAKDAGYKVYLYYISTEDPEINVNRVLIRTSQGGHPVPEAKIRSRYVKSLDLLKPAIQLTHRTFLFDNTHQSILFSEITNGENVNMLSDDVPYWFIKYVYNK